MIKIVNIIPQSLSGETNQDSEPNIAVNPANPLQIAASAFTPNPVGGSTAPIFISTDGGDSWTLNNIVPSSGGSGTGDITLRFAGNSNWLFTSILDGTSHDFEVHRTNNFTSPVTAAVLESRSNQDQPYIQAATVLGGSGVGQNRVYIGVNDFNAPGGRTSTIEQSLDATIAAPIFTTVRLEPRANVGQNGPQVRPALHPDGTIYATYYGWRAQTGSWPGNTLTISNADVVVVRDDNWGSGASPYTALLDGDGLAGKRVVSGISFPFNRQAIATQGQERFGGDLTIAVDPRTSSTVYIAWADMQAGVYTVHVRRSTDRGITWSADVLTIPNGKNPALAINSLGKVALLHQLLTGTGVAQKWEIRFRDSVDGLTWTNTLLCSVTSQAPAQTFSPYMGDYIHMMAAGKDFYGIFSANNTPDLANFPQGVTYQRNHNFATKKLLNIDNVTQVATSIDPFFVKVTDFPTPESHSDYYIRDWTNSAADHDTGLEPSTNPVFYATSDVWNQRTNALSVFVSDQPQNSDPQNNGGNFAFARVSRNDSASSETVTAEFFVAEFGTGSPYGSIGSTTVTFAAGETSKIATLPWTLGLTTSTHLCLGVQIATASDPFVTPGLNGQTPGWPTTDLIVINDNNKGQRNMGVWYGPPEMSGIHYAIVRNAAKFARDVEVHLTMAEDVFQKLKNPTIQVVGEQPIKLDKPGVSIMLKTMQPGENRWVAFSIDSFRVKVGSALSIDFQEIVEQKVINGYRINLMGASAATSIRANLNFQASVLFRFTKGFGIAEVDPFLNDTNRMLKGRTIEQKAYFSLLTKHEPVLVNSFKALLDRNKLSDLFSIEKTLAEFNRDLKENSQRIFSSHGRLLHQLDALLTMVVKMQR